MDVIPIISTTRGHARMTRQPVSSADWQARYESYLQSSEWRRTRDAALRRADWTCSRCPAQRTLQVHHKTYVRLGRELADDLEVLCATCHEGHHIDETQKVRGIYLAVVSDVLARERFTSMSELLEAVKASCAKKKIPYDGSKVWRAVSLADANRHGILDAPKPRIAAVTAEALQSGALNRAVTKAEAREFCRDYGINVATHMMMPALDTDDYLCDMEHANRIRQQAAEMLK